MTRKYYSLVCSVSVEPVINQSLNSHLLYLHIVRAVSTAPHTASNASLRLDATAQYSASLSKNARVIINLCRGSFSVSDAIIFDCETILAFASIFRSIFPGI